MTQQIIPMEFSEKRHIREAALRAPRVYAGAVGQLLSRELMDWADFGYRFGGFSLVSKAADEILASPIIRGAVA